MPRLLVHFARFGPYHHARLQAAHEVLAPLGWEVFGLETAGNDATYAWKESGGPASGPRVITAFPGRVHEEITAKECRRVLHPLLESLNPDAIAIAGWASVDALSCLSWCRKHGRRRVVMSETREADGKRVWWKERIKHYLISRFDAALVGGKSHRDYLVKLGMPAGKIRFGYNVVDNEFFRGGALAIRNSKIGRESIGCPQSAVRDNSGYPNNPMPNIRSPYFLASNRFIERKNLLRLIEAYARYLHSTSNLQHSTSVPWDLCLLGDGELKADLIAQCKDLGLQVIEKAPWDRSSPQSTILNPQSSIVNQLCARPLTSDSSASHSHLAPLGTSGLAQRSGPTDPCPLTPGAVFFPGFRQIEELPRFYAHAGCFIHPALEEPWGLVINEAMASGLPILSGDNVGAAGELVDDGVNGWKFDASDVESIAACLGKVAALDAAHRMATGAASAKILEERCPTEAFGRGLAAVLGRLDR